MTAAPQRPPDRPVALTPIFENIPATLRERPHWVVWRYVWDAKRQRWDKPPRNARTGRAASTTDPCTWATFADAHTAYEQSQDTAEPYDGVGLCMANGLGGGDADHCLRADGLTPQAQAFVQLADTYTERSPSGAGVRFIFLGAPDCPGRKLGAFELYPRTRYLTITGHHLDGAPETVNERGDRVPALIAVMEAFRDAAKVSTRGAGPAPAGDVAHAGPLSDVAIIDSLHRDGAKWRDLLAGTWEPHYPTASESALGLCTKLAFYTQKNANQIDTIIRAHGLYAEKWDSPRGETTWGARTIEKAIRDCTDVYRGRVPTPIRPAVVVPDTPQGGESPPAPVAPGGCADALAQAQATIAELRARVAAQDRQLAQCNQIIATQQEVTRRALAERDDARELVGVACRAKENDALATLAPTLATLSDVVYVRARPPGPDGRVMTSRPELMRQTGLSASQTSLHLHHPLIQHLFAPTQSRDRVPNPAPGTRGWTSALALTPRYATTAEVFAAAERWSADLTDQGQKPPPLRERCPHTRVLAKLVCQDCGHVLAKRPATDEELNNVQELSHAIPDGAPTPPCGNTVFETHDQTPESGSAPADGQALSEPTPESRSDARPRRYHHVRVLTRCDHCGAQASVVDRYGATWCDVCAPPWTDLDVGSFAAGGG